MATDRLKRLAWPLGLAAAVLVTLFALSPMLASGYIGDDALNSLLPGLMTARHQSLWSTLSELNEAWLGQGRFFPLAYVGWLAYAWLPGLLAYKLYILALVGLDLVAFGYLVRRLSGSEAASLLAVSLLPALFQFRLYHDAILSYHGLLEQIFLYITLSLILLHRGLVEQRSRDLLGSLLLYLAGLLTYEITYPFFLLHLLLIATHARPRTLRHVLRLGAPYVALSMLGIGTSVLMRSLNRVPVASGLPSNPYIVYLDPLAVASTFLRQVVAAFPLSYFLFDPFHRFAGSLGTWPTRMVGWPLLLALGVAVLVGMSGRKAWIRGPERLNLALVGLGLLLLPATLVALSPKYQHEVVWGLGYLPVYISAFGVSILVAAAVTALPKALRASGALGLAVLVGSVGSLNYLNNQQVIAEQEPAWHHPRRLIEDALQHGVFEGEARGARLFVDTGFLWDSPAFYQMWMGPLGFVGSRGAYLDDPSGGPRAYDGRTHGPEARAYYLRYGTNEAGEGMAVLGQGQTLRVSDHFVYSALAEHARLFLRSKADGTVQARCVRSESDMAPETFAIEASALPTLASGADWRLVELRAPHGLLDLKSIGLSGFPVATASSYTWEYADRSELHLPRRAGSLVHVGFRPGRSGQGVELRPVRLADRFYLEALLRPEGHQAPYAALVGNHPGLSNFQGFVLQQAAGTENRYELSIGDGNRWLPGPAVQLQPGRDQYLAMVVEGPEHRARAYLDGVLVGTASLPTALGQSELPVCLGNWPGGDRPFKGWIGEISIGNGPLHEPEIDRTWRSLQNR